MKRLLLTGFEPFAGYAENPSAMLAGALAAEANPGLVVKAVLLPVSFERSFEQLVLEIEKFRPDFVISLGLAIGRAKITPERIAINFVDAKIPDNDGIQPRNVYIRRNGRDGAFSTLPIHDMVERALAAGVPAEVSNSAGTFVCNYLMYRLLELSRKYEFGAGFIHVPLLPNQAKLNEPSLEYAKSLAGIRAMLKAFVMPRELPIVESFDAEASTSNRLPI